MYNSCVEQRESLELCECVALCCVDVVVFRLVLYRGTHIGTYYIHHRVNGEYTMNWRMNVAYICKNATTTTAMDRSKIKRTHSNVSFGYFTFWEDVFFFFFATHTHLWLTVCLLSSIEIREPIGLCMQHIC